MSGHSSEYPAGTRVGAFFRETENYKQCRLSQCNFTRERPCGTQLNRVGLFSATEVQVNRAISICGCHSWISSLLHQIVRNNQRSFNKTTNIIGFYTALFFFIIIFSREETKKRREQKSCCLAKVTFSSITYVHWLSISLQCR